jgi:SAM-dependent methyltransferase
VNTNLPENKYISSDYFRQNPTWDSEDSPWKATLVSKILQASDLNPGSVCEVGCGAGRVLAELRHFYPQAKLFGYDIAPDATRFWPEHEHANIRFQFGDFFALNKEVHDIIMLLDVIEHVADPLAFLTNLRGAARHYILHIPLDLSAVAVLREKPILYQREKAGHIHYFTKNLALSLLRECGYNIVEWRYSGATFEVPRRTWKTRLASIPRGLAYALNKDLGVRALGGETLIVLAESVTAP